MAQRWRKGGVLLAAQQYPDRLISHTAIPFVEHVAGHDYRLYFTSRDRSQRSHLWEAILELGPVPRCTLSSHEPCFSPGDLGTFDDSGAMGKWLVADGDQRLLYYTGWNLGTTVPFRYAIGLAMRPAHARTFTRYSDGPIIDRSPVDPCLAAAGCVLREGDLWRMWYVSGVRWVLEHDRPKHYYHIKYAYSSDGVEWQRPGTVCIDFQTPAEYAFSRPCVVHKGDRYHMWYSYRGGTYRIGYAQSSDGIHWERQDDAVGLTVSDSGWDSEMVAYPYVFEHNGTTYMLYNGNGYGASGIGYAVLEES